MLRDGKLFIYDYNHQLSYQKGIKKGEWAILLTSFVQKCYEPDP